MQTETYIEKNTIGAKKFVSLPKFQVYSLLKLIPQVKNCAAKDRTVLACLEFNSNPSFYSHMKKLALFFCLLVSFSAFSQGLPGLGAGTTPNNRPILHGKKWVAITGKPLGATAGAMVFQKGGNAVDAACAMIAATSTMWAWPWASKLLTLVIRN